MTPGKLQYLSFLLRLWPVGHNGSETWRASLENPHTGERRTFSSITLLINFLTEQTQAEYDENQSSDRNEGDEQGHV